MNALWSVVLAGVVMVAYAMVVQARLSWDEHRDKIPYLVRCPQCGYRTHVQWFNLADDVVCAGCFHTAPGLVRSDHTGGQTIPR